MRNKMANEQLKKLLALVQKQQQIIEKLAQQAQLQPQHMEPAKVEFHPETVIKQHLAPAIANSIYSLKVQGNTLWVSFKKGMATQANFDAVLKAVQQLVNKNLIPFAYEVKAVSI